MKTLLSYSIRTNGEKTEIHSPGQKMPIVCLYHGDMSRPRQCEVIASLCRDLAAELLSVAHDYNRAAGTAKGDFDASAREAALNDLRERMRPIFDTEEA